MPFVSVKCPSCGGNIQLDDSRESGFCVYCGAKVMYKEVVQKMQLSGEVSVKGVADVERLLQNAETFHKLGFKYVKKEVELLTKVTEEYPEDWRGWWHRCLIFLEPGDCNFHDPKFRFGVSNTFDNYSMQEQLIDNSLAFAPPDEVTEMKAKIRKWAETNINYYTQMLACLYEDVVAAKKEDQIEKSEAECSSRAYKILEKDKKRLFSKHLQFDDVYSQELISAGISPNRLKGKLYSFHLMWNNADDDYYYTVGCCLKDNAKVEANTKKLISDLQKMKKKYN